MIRLLIFLESGRCWLWDTRNPSNTSPPIWLLQFLIPLFGGGDVQVWLVFSRVETAQDSSD